MLRQVLRLALVAPVVVATTVILGPQAAMACSNQTGTPEAGVCFDPSQSPGVTQTGTIQRCVFVLGQPYCEDVPVYSVTPPGPGYVDVYCTKIKFCA